MPSYPILGDFAGQDIARGVCQLSAYGVASVSREVSVHEAPYLLDGIFHLASSGAGKRTSHMFSVAFGSGA